MNIKKLFALSLILIGTSHAFQDVHDPADIKEIQEIIETITRYVKNPEDNYRPDYNYYFADCPPTGERIDECPMLTYRGNQYTWIDWDTSTHYRKIYITLTREYDTFYDYKVKIAVDKKNENPPKVFSEGKIRNETLESVINAAAVSVMFAASGLAAYLHAKAMYS